MLQEGKVLILWKRYVFLCQISVICNVKKTMLTAFLVVTMLYLLKRLLSLMLNK